MYGEGVYFKEGSAHLLDAPFIGLFVYDQNFPGFLQPIGDGEFKTAFFGADTAGVTGIDIVALQAVNGFSCFSIVIHNGVVVNLEDARRIDTLRAGHTAPAGGAGEGLERPVSISYPADHQFLRHAKAIS